LNKNAKTRSILKAKGSNWEGESMPSPSCGGDSRGKYDPRRERKKNVEKNKDE